MLIKFFIEILACVNHLFQIRSSSNELHIIRTNEMQTYNFNETLHEWIEQNKRHFYDIVQYNN